MNGLVLARPSTTAVPALIAAAGDRAGMRFLEFFAANIRNPHTRRAYYRAAEEFLAAGCWASAPVPGWGVQGGKRVQRAALLPSGCFSLYASYFPVE